MGTASVPIGNAAASAVSSAPQLLVRGLDANGDVLWGQGRANFLTDVNALGQLLVTRLTLFLGEWYLNLADGLPLWQSILGVPGAANTQAVSLVIQARILATPFVLGLSSIQCTFNHSTRALSFFAMVVTQFGQVSLAINMPVPPSGALP